MSNFYLVGKDKKSNKLRIVAKSSKLEELDNFTTDFHNRHILSNYVGDGLSKDMVFFIVRPIVKGNKTYLDIMDVLYSDSKEIKLIMGSNESANNLLDHFYDKMRSNIDFYDMVINVDRNIYPRFKNYFTHEIITDKEELKEKDGGWVTDDYILLRNMVASLSKYEKRKRSKKSDSRRLLEKLIIEKRAVSKIEEENNKNQLNFFDKLDNNVDDSKLLDVMCMFRHLYYGFLEISNGEIRITNNLLTIYENLEKLDSLLDPRIGYLLYEYLENKYNYGIALDEETKNKYKVLTEKIQREMIEALMSDSELLNKTYNWSLIISINKDRILGDYRERQMSK